MGDPVPSVPPGGVAPAVPHAPSLRTPTFVLTWCATFAFFVSFYLLLPTIPLYVLALGGTEAQVGLVIGLLTVTSTISRPCVAPAIDRRRRKPFMGVGAAIFVVSGLLYPLATSIPRLLLLRLFHGCGMGIFMTAATTLVAAVAPLRRRGEALGAYGLGINLAMAVAPAAGMAIVNHASFLALFGASAAVALVGLGLTAALPEPRRPPQPGAAEGAGVAPGGAHARGHIISRAAIFPSMIVMAQTITYGAVLSFLPIWGRANRLENPGTFFTLFALALLAVRTRAGKLSDRFGRGVVIVPGLGVIAAAMVLLAAADRPWQVLAAGVVYGAGMGAVHPSLAAFVTDRAPEAERARAFATYYGSFELGIAVGSIGLGPLLEATSFPTMWVAAGAVAVLGAGTYIIGARRGMGRAPSGPTAEAA